MKVLLCADVVHELGVGKDMTVGRDDDRVGKEGGGEHDRPEERTECAFVTELKEEEGKGAIGACLTGGNAGPAVVGDASEDDLLRHGGLGDHEEIEEDEAEDGVAEGVEETTKYGERGHGAL